MFFANPRVDPKWFTSPSTLALIGQASGKVAAELLDGGKLEDQVKGSMKSSVVATIVANSSEVAGGGEVAVPAEESEASNYVSSLEVLGNGLYSARLKLKRVTVDDYKEFKVKFATLDGKVVEHVVALKKTGCECFWLGCLFLGGAGALVECSLFRVFTILFLGRHWTQTKFGL